uniref:Predicted protein n=1 Tax=Hordeum vulgare subsp. vulgare TaxID=112509 RepID=F2EJG6_HORVV|nr:predicted protein [Hordeum vulgare subsp. vulgare]
MCGEAVADAKASSCGGLRYGAMKRGSGRLGVDGVVKSPDPSRCKLGERLMEGGCLRPPDLYRISSWSLGWEAIWGSIKLEGVGLHRVWVSCSAAVVFLRQFRRRKTLALSIFGLSREDDGPTCYFVFLSWSSQL